GRGGQGGRRQASHAVIVPHRRPPPPTASSALPDRALPVSPDRAAPSPATGCAHRHYQGQAPPAPSFGH
ncbi:hypothetical protein, partial [Buchananella hordeovulneris]|uniref:hypothetical protein n=1 Tax=Buchananella hordeovulneris TaxID=52770 RepID=UPI001C9E25B0